MTLQTLLETMEAEGQKELAVVVAEHERRAEAILADGRERAERHLQERVGEAEREAQREAHRLVATARTAEQAVDRAAVEDQLRAVRMRAEQALASLLGTARGEAATVALLDEALDLLPTATVCLVDPTAMAAVRERHPDLDVRPAEHGLGVVLGDDAGRHVDNTAASRLEAAWPLLRPVVAGAVTTPGEGGAP